ncbi:MAG: hypothetical protein ACI4NA_08075 [Succinivibrio sp.]
MVRADDKTSEGAVHGTSINEEASSNKQEAPFAVLRFGKLDWDMALSTAGWLFTFFKSSWSWRYAFCVDAEGKNCVVGIIKAGDGGSGDFEVEKQKLRNLVLQLCKIYHVRDAMVVAAGKCTIVGPRKADEICYESASDKGLRALVIYFLGRGSWVRQFTDEQSPHFGSKSEAMWSEAFWKNLSDKASHDYLDLGEKILENKIYKQGFGRWKKLLRRGSQHKA